MDIHNLLGIMLTNKYIKIFIYLKYEKSKWEQLCMRRLPPPPAASIGINLKYQLCLPKIVNISLVIKIC